MSHAYACLTPNGRLRLAQLVVDKRSPLRRAADGGTMELLDHHRTPL